MPGIKLAKWYALQLAVMDPRLRGKAPAVLARLLDHHNSGTGLCFPSLKTLANSLCCEDRTVRSAIRLLEKNGYIKTYRGCSPYGTNQYELLMPSVKEEYKRAEKRLQDYRKKKSAKPSKEPSNKPDGTQNDGVLGKGQGATGRKEVPASRARRKCLEDELLGLLGGGEDAWNKMFEIPEAEIEYAVKSMNGTEASIREAAFRLLRQCQISEVFGPENGSGPS